MSKYLLTLYNIQSFEHRLQKKKPHGATYVKAMGNEDQEQSSVEQGSSCNLTTPKICYYKYDSNNIYMQATFIRSLDL